MKTLIETNETLSKMTANIKLAKGLRAEAVKVAINSTLEFCKENRTVFSNKKNAINVFIKTVLTDKNVDTYTKRAIKVAKCILSDGYKMRKELLTLVQMEQLCSFKVNIINELMQEDEADYIDAVKELINSAKKETKTFSKTKARSL